MDLNIILDNISLQQSKPRLKEKPLSESEIIRAYSIITEERYNLIAEDSRMKINELLSYGEETDDDIKEAEKYDPNPKRKMKTALGRAWTIIKKLIKALIDILKSLIHKVLSVFKKKKKDIEDAVEVEIQTYDNHDDKLLLEAYNNSYNNTKSAEIRKNEAKKIVETYSDYINYLQISTTKKVISFADLNMLKQIKQNLQEHVAANKLLFNVPTTYTCHNEFHINWQYKNIDCKSLLDRVMFDHVNKKIILIDLKTTSDIYNFKHSVEEFDYYRQIAFYLCAITWYMLNELNLNVDDYDLEAYIIAIQTNGKYEVRVFNMFNEEELLNRKNIIAKTLTEISYHINSGNWEHTRKYYENDGIEELRT